MAAQPLMTWDGKNRRWRKFYRGRPYVISCRQLGVPETKEKSYQAANAWWLARKAEIDGELPPHPYSSDLELLKARQRWAREQGRSDLADTLGSEAERIQARGTPSWHEQHAGGAELGHLKRLLDQAPDHLREEVWNAIDPLNAIWSDRIEQMGSEQVPEDRTLKAQVERYLDGERERVDQEEISPSEYDQIRLCLSFFMAYVGPEASIETIDEEKWESWFRHIRQSQGSTEYKKKRLRHSRNLVDWLDTKGLLAAPRNLRSRKQRFSGYPKAVPTIPPERVLTLIQAATGQLKLHLLLMINCGMTQADISDLAQDEVNLDQGRIVRRRSKTAHHENVPVVSYRLWPATLALLQQYREPEGPRVLLTQKGKPWLVDRVDETGKRSKTDNIKSSYRRLCQKMGFEVPLKWLRKTSASLLYSHATYIWLAEQFLGHAPRSVAEKSYLAPSTDLFDEALLWLGRQYGLVEPS